MEPNAAHRKVHWALLISGAGVLVWSGIAPVDRFTWLLEVAPAVAGAAVLLATARRFRFSTLAYTLVWVHAILLMIGGHWTYAEMPLFNWLRDTLHLARNHYDRVGHLAQGFIPAILAREILLRTSPLRRGKWLFAIVLSFCLAFSALYDLLEWWTSAAVGESADQFLALQGDEWDSQWDMLLALIGAVAAQLLLARAHDRSMARLAADH